MSRLSLNSDPRDDGKLFPMPLAMGETYDSSMMSGESSSEEFKRLSIDELCMLCMVMICI